MHAEHFLSIEFARALPLFVCVLQAQHGSIVGGAAFEFSTQQHAETAQALNHPRAQILAMVSSVSEVSEVHSTGNQLQGSSDHHKVARVSMAQRKGSTLQRVMRSESSRRDKGNAPGSMVQRRDVTVQSLMRSEKPKLDKRVLEREILSLPMQVLNGGHMSFSLAEKARATTGFDSHPSSSTGKQTSIVDQRGDAAPDLEIAPRRDEHVLGKGSARDSMAQRRNSKVQSLMQSESSKQGKEAHEHTTSSLPMQVLNGGHMPFFPDEKARAGMGFDSHLSGSIGKQAVIVDRRGEAMSGLEIAPGRDENVVSKTQQDLAERRLSAAEDVHAERASEVLPHLEQRAVTASNGNLCLNGIIVVLLLISCCLVLTLDGRRPERQEDRWARRYRSASIGSDTSGGGSERIFERNR